ncbi:MAG: calcium/sodium antiporter [Paludibacteraceae bacterium]|nr:calcium/sodium antiporter [Paludibacteraceae bacterium]
MLDFLESWLTTPCLLAVVLIVGFALLVKGADWLVDGASSIARQMGVSDLIIGLTVVAFGTSMPEFVVNMISASEGSTQLAITNILGSNAINIFVILGLTAVIWPVSSESQSRRVDIPLACVGALLILSFACIDFEHFALVLGTAPLGRIAGIVLFLIFVGYMIYLFRKAKTTPSSSITGPVHEEKPVEGNAKSKGLFFSLVLVLLGLLGLTIGGECCVKSAVAIATQLGVSEAVIGLTIVALGTSLPELATSCMAAAKHNSDLALGNCVGSCTFNIFFVLSISALVHPLPAYQGLVLDAAMAFIGPGLVWLFVVGNRRHLISRSAGAILLLIYVGYLTYRLITV